jgi:hypothetical protein
MAEPAPEMSADAPAGPSVRASLLVCTTSSLIVLWIAAFEMPMADVAFIFHPVLQPAILSFLACGLWSVFQLTRIRKHGVKFASPFLVCALTVAALVYAPFTQIYLQGNFWWHLADRERIAARVEAGELTPNVTYNRNVIVLGENEPSVSLGDDIVIDQTAEGTYVLFLTSRSIRDYFSGFLHVPPGGDPAKFFEFANKPPMQLVQYGKDWYFVAN